MTQSLVLDIFLKNFTDVFFKFKPLLRMYVSVIHLFISTSTYIIVCTILFHN